MAHAEAIHYLQDMTCVMEGWRPKGTVVNVVQVLGGYEAHFSREIDRILNRLERLQRIRKGQPLPTRLDVKIS
jgi:hypothetical protein